MPVPPPPRAKEVRWLDEQGETIRVGHDCLDILHFNKSNLAIVDLMILKISWRDLQKLNVEVFTPMSARAQSASLGFLQAAHR